MGIPLSHINFQLENAFISITWLTRWKYLVVVSVVYYFPTILRVMNMHNMQLLMTNTNVQFNYNGKLTSLAFLLI